MNFALTIDAGKFPEILLSRDDFISWLGTKFSEAWKAEVVFFDPHLGRIDIRFTRHIKDFTVQQKLAYEWIIDVKRMATSWNARQYELDMLIGPPNKKTKFCCYFL